MGAVFALYSAWYFWAPKITGLFYNQRLSKSHFWILFVGVNLTFFPQHFLGLQGMPRRISDYADAFAGWNMVSSLGSIVSVIATYVFLHIVYVQLRGDLFVIRNPWTLTGFYSDMLRVINTRVSTSLEWVLSNPPKPHAFISLPLQSNILCSWLKKRMTKDNIIRSLKIFIVGLALRSLILTLIGINVFYNPFSIISILYYAFMAMYVALQYEVNPMEAPIEGPMLAPVSMLEASKTKNSGVITMNSDKGIGGGTNHAPEMTMNSYNSALPGTNANPGNNNNQATVSSNVPGHDSSNPVEPRGTKRAFSEENMTMDTFMKSSVIVGSIDDETAPISALIHAHTNREFSSVGDELNQIEEAKAAVAKISQKLEQLENIIRNQNDN